MKIMPHSLMLSKICSHLVCHVYVTLSLWLIVLTGINPEADEDTQQDHFAESRRDGDYAPYPNRVVCCYRLCNSMELNSSQMMLLDILDNLPCLRMSSSQFQMILWLLRECRVKDVPSFGAFRKLQQNLRQECGTQPSRHTSSVGNIFYVNDVRESVARVCSYYFQFCAFINIPSHI